MSDFFIQVAQPKRKGGGPVYHVMERYREADDPFEKVQKVATCTDVESAAKLQGLFDHVAELEKAATRARTASAPTTASATMPPRDKLPAPETNVVVQPTHYGQMTAGVVREDNSKTKPQRKGERPTFKGADIPALRSRAVQAEAEGA